MIKDYIDFITSVAVFINSLQIPNNTIIYASIISNLIHEGKFSLNSKIKITENNDVLKNIFGYMGLDIVRGYGCCRHFSSIFIDVFQKVGKSAIAIPVNYKNEIIKSNKLDNASHSIVMIEYDNTVYGYDVIGSRLYRFVNKNVLFPYTISSYAEQLTLEYNPISDMIQSNYSKEEIIQKLLFFEEASFKQYINDEQLNNILMDCWDTDFKIKNKVIRFCNLSYPKIRTIAQ